MLFFITVAFISCEKEDSGKNIQESKIEKKIVNRDFNKIGILHNQAMDYIFDEDLKNKFMILADKAKEDGFIDSLEVINIIVNKTNRFLNENPTVEIDGKLINIDFNIPFNKVVEMYYSNPPKNYFLDCEGDIVQSKQCVDELLSEFMNNTSHEDYNLVMCSGFIYKNSIDYWSNNESNYYDYFLNFSETERGWFNWRSFAGADLRGAISGAMYGGSLGPGGAVGGALAIGICGSAINASGQALIQELSN